MLVETTDPGILRPKELEAVYAISRAVTQSDNMDTALGEIIHLSRPVFIFDSIMVYLPQEKDAVEPSFVKVIGRGQSSEGDLDWGEVIAGQVFKSGQILIERRELEKFHNERLGVCYFLGLPLRIGENKMGVLVFGRFGGPTYTPDQIHLAEFIAIHVAQLFGRQQLVEQVAKLEAERRLERLQQDFIATISHELCTPLGFIKGYATTLLRDDTNWDTDTRKEFLLIIDEEADKLRELIDNLLDSSRLQSGTLHMQFQLVRLEPLLKDIAMRVRTRSENLSLTLDLKTGGLRCMVDPTRIAQVLDNLLSNAVKYAPGAPVTISLETIDDKAHISVRDEGPGIAPEYCMHLFKKFYRVPDSKSTTRGTGLGLFICRQIIDAHGGEISVASVVGKGTTFHIYLPCPQVKESKIKEEEKP